jgi:putative transposase
MRIAEYYKEHGSAGYRAVTYRMMVEDVVAGTPRTVYRVLKSGGFSARSNDKKQSTKGQGHSL